MSYIPAVVSSCPVELLWMKDFWQMYMEPVVQHVFQLTCGLPYALWRAIIIHKSCTFLTIHGSHPLCFPSCINDQTCRNALNVSPTQGKKNFLLEFLDSEECPSDNVHLVFLVTSCDPWSWPWPLGYLYCDLDLVSFWLGW